MTDWTLGWDRGHIAVRPTGAMMAPVEIVLDDGRKVFPFKVAPWADERFEPPVGPLLQGLRGDWTCLPFGLPGKPRTDLLPDWMTGVNRDLASPDAYGHGAVANEPWVLDSCSPDHLACHFDFPEEMPIERVSRAIHVLPGEAMISVVVEITARRTCEMPWGLHPTFALPEEPGAFEIGFEGPVRVFTYPGEFEKGVSRAAHGQVVPGLDAVPMMDGSTLSFARLPLGHDAEELLIAADHGGRVILTNHAERYRTILDWDATVLPGLLLWVSNRGRKFAPWNGRFLGLGVEPISAAFDLGYAHGLNPASPLRAAGVGTATRFAPGAPLKTSYSFRFEAL